MNLSRRFESISGVSAYKIKTFSSSFREGRTIFTASAVPFALIEYASQYHNHQDSLILSILGLNTTLIEEGFNFFAEIKTCSNILLP